MEHIGEPWKLDDFEICDREGCSVARTGYWPNESLYDPEPTYRKNMARAHLIAAAPEIYTALVDMLALNSLLLDGMERGKFEPGAIGRILDTTAAAKSAIARAAGDA